MLTWAGPSALMRPDEEEFESGSGYGIDSIFHHDLKIAQATYLLANSMGQNWRIPCSRI